MTGHRRAGEEPTGAGEAGAPRWRPNRRSDVLDAALTAVLGVAAGASLYIGGHAALFGTMSDYWRPAGIALTVLCVAPLLVRRRFPLAVLGVITTAFVPLTVLEVPELNATVVALFIALYTAGAYGLRRRLAPPQRPDGPGQAEARVRASTPRP